MQTFILRAQLVKGFMQGFADVRGRGGRAFLEGKHDARIAVDAGI